jgi:hypothetical protein
LPLGLFVAVEHKRSKLLWYPTLRNIISMAIVLFAIRYSVCMLFLECFILLPETAVFLYAIYRVLAFHRDHQNGSL